jgi:hypothetical protein
MTITITSKTDLTKTATFTWSDDGQDCDVLAVGFSDAEIDAMIEAKAHEGADFNGCTVEIN